MHEFSISLGWHDADRPYDVSKCIVERAVHAVVKHLQVQGRMKGRMEGRMEGRMGRKKGTGRYLR